MVNLHIGVQGNNAVNTAIVDKNHFAASGLSERLSMDSAFGTIEHILTRVIVDAVSTQRPTKVLVLVTMKAMMGAGRCLSRLVEMHME